MNGGTLKVPTITGDLTNNGGTLAPGTVPGLRSIGGNLAENAGVLQILLSGTTPAASPGFDKLQISGNATLGGTLTVSLTGGFNPVIGQSFQFLTAAAGVSGAFSTISGSPGSGNAWQLSYGATSVSLTVVSAGSGAAASVFAPGYNMNGDRPTSVAAPEPSTLISLAVGATTMGLMRARRRNEQASPIS
jgi:hypothetical protein